MVENQHSQNIHVNEYFWMVILEVKRNCKRVFLPLKQTLIFFNNLFNILLFLAKTSAYVHV